MATIFSASWAAANNNEMTDTIVTGDADAIDFPAGRSTYCSHSRVDLPVNESAAFNYKTTASLAAGTYFDLTWYEKIVQNKTSGELNILEIGAGAGLKLRVKLDCAAVGGLYRVRVENSLATPVGFYNTSGKAISFAAYVKMRLYAYLAADATGKLALEINDVAEGEDADLVTTENGDAITRFTFGIRGFTGATKTWDSWTDDIVCTDVAKASWVSTFARPKIGGGLAGSMRGAGLGRLVSIRRAA